MLLAVLKTTSQRKLAARIGADQASVCRWANGAQNPGLEAATRLEQIFGIPAAAWVTPAADGELNAAEG